MEQLWHRTAHGERINLSEPRSIYAVDKLWERLQSPHLPPSSTLITPQRPTKCVPQLTIQNYALIKHKDKTLPSYLLTKISALSK